MTFFELTLDLAALYDRFLIQANDTVLQHDAPAHIQANRIE
jgi:hypothetical protein